jgi:hypothetical protein
MVLAATMTSPEIAWSSLAPLLILLGGTCALLLVGHSCSSLATSSYTYFDNRDCTHFGCGALCVQWNNLYYRKGYSIVADAISVDRFAVLTTIIITVAVALGALLASAHHDDCKR